MALWSGTSNSAKNIAPIVIFVIFWVGVPFASLVLGDIWQALSPFDTLAAIVERLRGSRPAAPDQMWAAGMDTERVTEQSNVSGDADADDASGLAYSIGRR